LKKIVIFIGISLLGFCVLFINNKDPEKQKTEESIVLETSSYDEEIVLSTAETGEEKDQVKENNSKSIDVKKLLEEFGDAYANYRSINERNEHLKKIMTKECAEANGINFDSGIMTPSTGEVIAIYKPMGDELMDQYAVLLDCKQNGTQLKILLLVKMKDDKVSEMTYNTIKQEY
jgi:hypothetical protein